MGRLIYGGLQDGGPPMRVNMQVWPSQTCEQNCSGVSVQVWLPSAASCAPLDDGITSPYHAPLSLLPMRQVINYDQLGVHFRYNEILKEYLK